MKKYDAIVAGAGPAGATAAWLLARAGWSVAVVEKASFPRKKVCGEYISPGSLSLLNELGIAGEVMSTAGPDVRQIGLYAFAATLVADMPRTLCPGMEYGSAIGREHLDMLLLARAKDAGAEVWQPWELRNLASIDDGFVCTATRKQSREFSYLQSRIVVAAHGSWEHGALPTQSARSDARASDLLAFKARFTNCRLPPGLMPLVVFPGGYGGMVHSDNGRVSFSCCIRRDVLERCRLRWQHIPAGEAVFAHIQASCDGVRHAFANAEIDGAWMASGPIRPGIRAFRADGIFAVGNAAGEAHPIVAEGISMAIQSAWLLCERLVMHDPAAMSKASIREISIDYRKAWKRNFRLRILCAAAFAHLAMRTALAKPILAVLKQVPAFLSAGARLCGKAQPLNSRNTV
jgi:flavin-dependent dehydrogenase